MISVTEVADSAIPAYEALAAAEIPHSIPLCPPASASGQDLIAPPARVPSLTVARADTPAGEHIGWARVPGPRPRRSDAHSSSADGSGLSLLQKNVRLKRIDIAAAGLPAAHSREQEETNTVLSVAGQCSTPNPPAPALVVPTPLGRRQLVRANDCAQPAGIQSDSVPPPVPGLLTEATLVDSLPVPRPLNIDAALSPPTDDQGLRQAVHLLRAPWRNFWRGDLCSLPGLPACFLSALRHCVPALDIVQHVHLFTDGSFIAGSPGAKCGWGICAVFEGLCQQQHAFAFAGFAGGPLETFLQRPVGALNTSYFAETAAAVVAVAWQLSLPACVPVTLWYDCQAVGGVINGHMAPKAGQGCLSLASRLRSVVHLVESVRGNACRAVWLPSHAGNPFNELADCVAKAGAKLQIGDGGLAAPLWSLLQSPLLSWAWMLPGRDTSMPLLPDLLQGKYEECDRPSVECVMQPQPEPSCPTVARLAIKIVSCNVQTLRGKKPLVAQQLVDRKINITGLQETRLSQNSEINGAAFFEFFSAASSGEGGCALLFSRQVPYAWRGLQPLFFDKSHFTCVHSTPRHLAVRVKAPFLDMLVVTAHAPQSGSGNAAIDTWWHEFMQAPWLQPFRGRIVACLDANAQLGSVETEQVGRHAGTSETPAGAALREWLHLMQAFLPATFFNAQGRCIPSACEPTWFSPSGSGYRIDYIALPAAWIADPCRPSVLEDFELLNKDHLPVLVEVSRLITGMPPAKAPLAHHATLCQGP